MKVKISYSVDIDNIPDNVIKILEQVESNFETVSEKLHHTSAKAESTREYLKILDEIDQIRKEMFQIDSQLEECYDIVGGYQRVRIKQHTQEHHALDMADQQHVPPQSPEPEPAKTKGKK